MSIQRRMCLDEMVSLEENENGNSRVSYLTYYKPLLT